MKVIFNFLVCGLGVVLSGCVDLSVDGTGDFSGEGIPEEVEICVTLPLGWPDRPFGTITRKPLEEVVHRDRW